jgi:hypothetical protein
VASAYWVVTSEEKQTKKGPVVAHTLFGGKRFMDPGGRSRAERFKEDLDCPAEVYHLDTTQIGKAAQKLRGMGVMGAMSKGRDWHQGMTRFKHGRGGGD